MNLAYEAATVDLNDANVIDHFHLSAHGEQTVNYNRDVEAFPLLKSMLERLTGTTPLPIPLPTWGVNMAGLLHLWTIKVCWDASNQEIIRRYFKALVDEARDNSDSTQSDRAAVIMAKAGITVDKRAVVAPARAVEAATGEPGSAIQLHDGTIITGATSELLGCSAAMLLNALKYLAGS